MIFLYKIYHINAIVELKMSQLNNEKDKIGIASIEKNTSDIIPMIHTIRGFQVMLDRDLADFYQTDTRTLKQAVKRNLCRFPSDFMFELTENEIQLMVSQFVIPSKSHFGGSNPFVFTEQGVAMLTTVLKSRIAIEASLRILRAFVEMRKLLTGYSGLIQRVDRIEQKQTEQDQYFEKVFKALESDNLQKKQGVFFEGQTFDAYTFVSDIIRSARKSIQIIDNYVDDSVLLLLSKRGKNIKVIFYTSRISNVFQQDIQKHNAQYDTIEVKLFNSSHDRFLIIDRQTVYHLGASLKDLGKKWFAFSLIERDSLSILERLEKL